MSKIWIRRSSLFSPIKEEYIKILILMWIHVFILIGFPREIYLKIEDRDQQCLFKIILDWILNPSHVDLKINIAIVTKGWDL